MRTTTTLFAVATIFASGLAVGQEEPGPNYQHLKPMAWMVGEWVYDTELPEDVPGMGKEGDAFRVVVAHRWQVNKSALQLNVNYIIGGKKYADSVGIVGWDAGKKQVVSRGFDARGGSSTGILTFPNSDTIKVISRDVSPEGEVSDESVTIERINPDTFKFTSAEGQEMEFKRQK